MANYVCMYVYSFSFVEFKVIFRKNVSVEKIARQISSALSDRVIRYHLNHEMLFGRSCEKKPLLPKEKYGQTFNV